MIWFLKLVEEKRDLFLKFFSFNKNIENDRFRCCPYCYNSFNLFSRSDAAEEKLVPTSSCMQDCLTKQLFIEKHKVTGQNVDIYTFQMILRFVVKAFEEERSLLLPEVYDRYKLLLQKNDLDIVIDSDKDMSKLLHFTQLIFNMVKSVLGRALLCYVPKKEQPWSSDIQKWCRCFRKLPFTIFGKSSLIKPNCPDGESKLKINKYNFFSYYRWFKEEQEAWKSWTCSTNFEKCY